jgi:hypothetical protein
MIYQKGWRGTLYRIGLYLQGLTPWIAVPRVCEFSMLWWDIHDYPTHKGGDGTPAHFTTYTCWGCLKRFTL